MLLGGSISLLGVLMVAAFIGIVVSLSKLSRQLDEAGYARIAEGFAGSAPHALARKLEDAANAVCAELAVDDGAARAYVRRLAGQLAPRVATALRCRSLEGVFVRWS